MWLFRMQGRFHVLMLTSYFGKEMRAERCPMLPWYLNYALDSANRVLDADLLFFFFFFKCSLQSPG